MFETFCLRLAAGIVFALLILPGHWVNPRFYRIQLLIVLGLTVAAGFAAWEKAAGFFWLPLGLAIAGILMGYGCWLLQSVPAGRFSLLESECGLLASLFCLSMQPGDSAATVSGIVADTATSAGVLGTAVTAMLMGHWYLISPTMSLQPLTRLLKVFFIVLGLRVLVAALELWPMGMPAASLAPEPTQKLWLLVRWVAGFLGAGILGWMAWQSAKIRATQSATGILYVVVIFSFFGELSDQLLRAYVDAK